MIASGEFESIGIAFIYSRFFAFIRIGSVHEEGVCKQRLPGCNHIPIGRILA